MQRYLVGGAVRDALLDLPVYERDWVVIGATAADMVDHGFRLKDEEFQIYLHPETGDEHALARIEKQTGVGHRGFVLEFGEHVTLEQDLARRDLTVNAIAQSESGEIIDPYNGCDALRSRTLRHVTKAFTEDPLRVFRCGQFLARLSHLGFHVHEATLQIMRQMSDSGCIDELSNHRVWSESVKALGSRAPSRYFELLFDLGQSKRVISVLRDMAASCAPDVLHQTLHLLDSASGTDREPEEQLARAYVAAVFAGIQSSPDTTVFPLDVMSKVARDRVVTAFRLAQAVRGWRPDPAWLLTELMQLDAVRRPKRLALGFTTVAQVSASAFGDGYLGKHCRMLREAAECIQAVRLDPATIHSGTAARGAIQNLRRKALEALLIQS